MVISPSCWSSRSWTLTSDADHAGLPPRAPARPSAPRGGNWRPAPPQRREGPRAQRGGARKRESTSRRWRRSDRRSLRSHSSRRSPTPTKSSPPTPTRRARASHTHTQHLGWAGTMGVMYKEATKSHFAGRGILTCCAVEADLVKSMQSLHSS